MNANYSNNSLEKKFYQIKEEIDSLISQMLLHSYKIQFKKESDLSVIFGVLHKKPQEIEMEESQLMEKAFKETQFFQEMTKEIPIQIKRKLLNQLQYKFLEKRQTLQQIGDFAQYNYFIMSGSVYELTREVDKQDESDSKKELDYLQQLKKEKNESNFIKKEFPGLEINKIYRSEEHFGEQCLKEDYFYEATYVCKEDCHFAFMDKQNYKLFIQEFQDFYQDFQFLKRYYLFTEMYDSEIETCLKSGEKITYLNNQIIYQEGEPIDYMYFILEGEIELSKIQETDIIKKTEKDKTTYINKECNSHLLLMDKASLKKQNLYQRRFSLIEDDMIPRDKLHKHIKKQIISKQSKNQVIGDEEIFNEEVFSILQAGESTQFDAKKVEIIKRNSTAKVTEHMTQVFRLKIIDYFSLLKKQKTWPMVFNGYINQILHPRVQNRDKSVTKSIGVKDHFFNFSKIIRTEKKKEEKTEPKYKMSKTLKIIRSENQKNRQKIAQIQEKEGREQNNNNNGDDDVDATGIHDIKINLEDNDIDDKVTLQIKEEKSYTRNKKIKYITQCITPQSLIKAKKAKTSAKPKTARSMSYNPQSSSSKQPKQKSFQLDHLPQILKISPKKPVLIQKQQQEQQQQNLITQSQEGGHEQKYMNIVINNNNLINNSQNQKQFSQKKVQISEFTQNSQEKLVQTEIIVKNNIIQNNNNINNKINQFQNETINTSLMNSIDLHSKHLNMYSYDISSDPEPDDNEDKQVFFENRLLSQKKEFQQILENSKNTVNLTLHHSKRPKVSDPGFQQYAENQQHYVFKQIEPMIDFKNAQNDANGYRKTDINIKNPLFKMGNLVEKKLKKYTLIQKIQNKNKDKEKEFDLHIKKPVSVADKIFMNKTVNHQLLSEYSDMKEYQDCLNMRELQRQMDEISNLSFLTQPKEIEQKYQKYSTILSQNMNQTDTDKNNDKDVNLKKENHGNEVLIIKQQPASHHKKNNTFNTTMTENFNNNNSNIHTPRTRTQIDFGKPAALNASRYYSKTEQKQRILKNFRLQKIQQLPQTPLKSLQEKQIRSRQFSVEVKSRNYSENQQQSKEITEEFQPYYSRKKIVSYCNSRNGSPELQQQQQ